MKLSRLLIMALTAVLTLASMLYAPSMSEAQSRASRVAGAYSEVTDATQPPETYTMITLEI